MKIRNLAVLAMALTLPLAATACGASGGSDSKSDTNSSSSEKDTSSDTSDAGDSSDNGGEADGNIGDMSAEDISKQLQEMGGMPEEQADCIAEALDKNELAYEDFGDASGPEALNDPKFKQYIEDAMTCFTGTTTP